MDKEDLYGFTLVGKNGVGLSKQPPQPGDMPQVWVEVDLTKPVVRLLGAEVIGVATPSTLLVLWSAADKNLSAAPITLSHAAQTGGPWLTLAGKIENTGRYVGKLPAGIPSRFLVRVEAADQAGNVGMAETPYPILADVARPSVSILGVAPAAN